MKKVNSIISVLMLMASMSFADKLELQTKFDQESVPNWIVPRYPLLELSDQQLKLKFHKGHATSMGIPIEGKDIDFEMNFKWQKGRQFTLRFEHAFNMHLCRVMFTAKEVILRVDQPEGKKTKDFIVLAKQKLDLDESKFHNLKFSVQGETVTALINDKVKLSGSHPILKNSKSSIILAMSQGSMQIQDLSVSSLDAIISKKPKFSFNKKAKVVLLQKPLKQEVETPRVKVANDDERALGLFNDYVLPSLKEHCYKCHSHEYKKAKGGLVLDSKSGIFGGGDLGPSVVARNLKKSWLFHAITWEDEDLEMPPKYKMSDEEIAHIKEWIELGAPDPRKGTIVNGEKINKSNAPSADEIWSFQPIKKPVIPIVKSAAWSQQPIDRFILAKLEDKSLSPNKLAEPGQILRRIYFNLTGLQPTVDKRVDFLDAYAQNSEQAISELIDELMDTKQYGERWARHWMDVVRYADVSGTTMPKPYKHAWKYRDYLVNSFNENKPFDQFVKEQLAGDLLKINDPNKATQAKIATGYLAFAHVVGADRDKERLKMDTIDEQLDVIGKTFLGLTIGCARCHDHKLDPISHKDYYAMAGIFRSTTKSMGGKGKNGISTVVDDKMIRDEPIHLRGDVYLYGDVVPRGFMSSIPVKTLPEIPENQSGRLQLAEWLLSEENTHTSRVIVNRIWHHLFGQGLVKTTDNFGSTGDVPSNQELLDYLAYTFRTEHQWSFKSFIKTIMLTKVWQLSTEDSTEAVEVDPNNRLHWRMNRRRLDAEALVDSVNQIAGTLKFEPATYTVPKFKSGNQASTSNLNIPDEILTHRALYWPVFRKDVPVEMDVLSIFGFPDASSPRGVRETVTVPAQSLYLMNSPAILNSSEKLASSLMTSQKGINDLVESAYQAVLNRQPSQVDLVEAKHFLSDISADFVSRGRDIQNAKNKAYEKLIHALLISNEFMIVE